MHKKLSCCLSLAFILLLSNCAKNISSSEYSEDEVGAIKQTYRGVILNVRSVKVQGSDRLQDNSMGLIGGGIGGAIIGSQFGKGSGSTIGGLVGAAAGALGGSLAEKKLKEQDGIEYTVELSSGRIMTIVQGPEPRLQSGQAVLVMVGDRGRSRVVADQTGGVSYAQRARQSQKQQANDMTPHFDDIDEGHRDTFARDAGERTRAPRVIIQ
jgi:outer membrane lipoprotein SlyB